MNAENNKLLSVRNLVVKYSSGKNIIHVVNDVSFDLEEGKCLGLVGESGAGKTTIAKAILRILPDQQACFFSGDVILDNLNLTKLSEKEMRAQRGKKIAMIFQDPMTALNPLMTVGSQIAEVIKLHHKKMNDIQIQERAMDMLEMVGIKRFRYNDYPHQFSGGMKQRVVVAIALACKPKLLLADEPTTALDVTIQRQILDLIKDLQQKIKTSMIFISHDLGVVAEISDYVAIMYAGEIVEYGTKRSIFKYPTHPYTRGLIYSLPEMNIGTKKLSSIPGAVVDPSNLPKGCSFHPRCSYATEECKKSKISLQEVASGHLCRCCNMKQEVEL